MKKLLVVICLLTTSLLTAQDHWDTLEPHGFGKNINFDFLRTFKGKLYVGGDSSSPSGLAKQAHSNWNNITGGPSAVFRSFYSTDGISFTEDSAFNAVVKGYSLCSTSADNNNMFFGTSVPDTTMVPLVYRFDGNTYTLMDTIPFDTTGDNRTPGIWGASISGTAALPGSDTVYAFVNSSVDVSYNSLFSTIYKSSISNPAWTIATRFPKATGINNISDVITWHNRFYITTSGRDSLAGTNNYTLSSILSSADGANWDTVGRIFNFLSAKNLPFNYNNFNKLAIHNDTLFVSVGGQCVMPIWYTADSLSANPAWNPYIGTTPRDSAIASSWGSGVGNMQSYNGKLWLVTISNGDGSISSTYECASKGLRHSSGYTYMENMNNYSDYLAAFAGKIYGAGVTSYVGSDPNFYNGNLFYLVPPVADFKDTATMGFCTGRFVNFTNLSVNSWASKWYVNDTLFSTATNPTHIFTSGGIYQIKLVAASDTAVGAMADSITKTITIYQSPVIDTVFATLTSICQGQLDTVIARVAPGSGPYNYGWTQSLNIIGLNDSLVNFTLTTVSTPSPSPIGFFVLDTNGCQTDYPYTLYITVSGSDSLSGHVVDSLLNPVNAGSVYLFQQKNNHVGVADSAGVTVLDANGYYYFPGLYYGDYFVKVVADTNAALYKTSVGTYYSNKTNAYQWDSALVIQQHTCVNGNNGGKDVQIIQIPAAPTGPGTITGNVSMSNSFGTRYSYPNAVFGAPLKGVDVKLGKNPGGSAAARTTTDTAGNYSFHNVPIGSYKIYVDIPNYGMDSVRIVDLTVNSVSVHNDYYVDSAMVHVVPIDSAIASICMGDSMLLGGAYQHNAGVYTDVLQTLWGYDSVIVTTLSTITLPTLTVSTSADSVCIGNSVTLSAAGTATSYLWSSNAASATTATVSVSPSLNTTYTVTATANGCPVSKTIYIVANNCVGIRSYNQSGISAYPNPATDKLFIETDKNGSVKLLNIVGQTVLEQLVGAGMTEISLAQLPQGVYELMVLAGGRTSTQKLVVTK